jgi:2-oxoisovalerate dehydrogenase E1 component
MLNPDSPQRKLDNAISGPISCLDDAYASAKRSSSKLRKYLRDQSNETEIKTALTVRAVESELYELFGKGKLHGTIHTCIGQEFSGVIVGKHLRPGDFITSNHRCHGHFIAASGNWRGLVDELVGNREGVCAGIGSSQHLWAENFLSNGQQAGLLPVAAGIALDRKTKKSDNVVCSFIGEGTLGEGVVYETLNLDALWGLPHIIVCENNFYSQSTPQSKSVSGSIEGRARAFGIETYHADTWDLPRLDSVIERAMSVTRRDSTPCFVNITTYRLNPHSKGDDSRDKAEIDWFRSQDSLIIAISEFKHFKEYYDSVVAEVSAYAGEAFAKPTLNPSAYFEDQSPPPKSQPIENSFSAVTTRLSEARVSQQLNGFYRDWLEKSPTAFFLGEDIEDPYGGAFKVSKGMTTAFPGRALTTPISEAAITGIGVGLATCGRRAFVEIMFGDFTTYAFDQIVNNASKFHHMYNRKVACPVIIRTPMGGRRGYGPTHSQSLERFFIGIDNCRTISLNSLVGVDEQLGHLADVTGPAIVFENKVDYTARTFSPPEGVTVEISQGAFPTIRVRAKHAAPGVTLVSFGGAARYVADRLQEIFEITDTVPELLALTSIHPLDVRLIVRSLQVTKRIVVIEEGALFGSVGAELLAQLMEQNAFGFRAARVGARPVPIPSVPALEESTLPNLDDICRAIASLRSES